MIIGSEYHLVTRKDWSKVLLFQFESGCDLFGVKNQITCRDRRQHENCHHYPAHTQDEINLARIYDIITDYLGFEIHNGSPW